MGVEESAALNEEEIICWLTLKRANTSSILTAVMVPHVVAAWLDEEERDATKANIFVRCFCSQNGVRSVYLLCISSSYRSFVSKRLREEANRVPAKKRTVYKCAYVPGWLVQLARNIWQLSLLTPGHVRLHANPFSLVDTVNQRNLIFYL